MTNFEIAVQNWLFENNIDCHICLDDDFGYDITNNTIHIGIIGYKDAGCWFEQFLYEYGMEYSGILYPVLSFIHEIGHHFTIANFTREETMFFDLMKNFLENRMDAQNEMNKYWEIPDEFSANVWAINFINDNIEAIEELCNIYYRYWNECVEEVA